MRSRILVIACAVTYALVIALLALVLLGSQQGTADGVTTDSGGRVALIGLAFAAVIPAFISRLDVTVPRWVPWSIGAVSLLIVVTLFSLVASGRNSLAWALYGGLQVLRAQVNFNDLDWVVQWLVCDLCDRWDPHYGPSLAWWNPLTGGSIDLRWVAPLGFVLAGTMVLGLIWLARRSTGRGTVVLLIAAVSPAWLLQLDRANLDGLVFLTIVAGGWLVSRRESLTTWTIFAVLIWLVGSLKYYPFAVGIALLPALRLRRGWLVLVGYATATATFMAVYWPDFLDSLRWNSEAILVTDDFPAYGRLMVLSRMGALGPSDTWLSPGNLLFAGLVFAALLWGLAWSLTLRTSSVALPSMALGGGTVFLSAVFVGGFGFMYKGIFLLPLIPLLSLPFTQRRSRMPLYTSIVSLVLIALSMTMAYSSVLTTLAGVIAAALAAGAGIGLVARMLRDRLALQTVGESCSGKPQARIRS